MRTLHKNILASAVYFSALMLFNNCEAPVKFRSDSKSTVNSSGNGDGYAGRPTIYNLNDANRPCSEIQTDGAALPNAQVLMSAGKADLVRDACKDVSPQPLPDARVNGDGSLS